MIKPKREMEDTNYLEGAIPYSTEMIKEYSDKGWWLNLTFGDILDRSVQRYPDKTAVIDERLQLTYSELKERVDRFALSLIRLGFKKNNRMLIQLPNRHEFLVAFYGMHRIGVVPILAIPRHGSREIAHFIRGMEPLAWILPLRHGKQEFGSLIKEVEPWAHGVEHMIMLGDRQGLPSDALSIEDLMAESKPEGYTSDYLGQFRPDPNDVAIILLTGGTTGIPKGVPRTHNSFLTNIRYTNADTKPEDVRALATPIGHSMAHQGPVGGSIFYGATLCLVPVPRSGTILEYIQRHKITTISLVPTQLEDILNDPSLDSFDLSSLRLVRTAGAALRPETVKRAQEFFRKWGADFAGGGFGSSEGPSASHRSGESQEVFHSSIGRPICDGDHWKAIDDSECELPPNTEGELVARGPCVFTGYFRSEHENRAIFTHDGYYRMGDLGRIDAEGHIYITGRKKDIIQRGGEGIIPSEIEDLLHINPTIDSAAVVAMPDPRLGEKACAYVTLKPGACLTFEEMVDFLKSRGASVLQLPERLEVVDELPKTSVGKIDKEALRRDIRLKLERGESNE